MILLEQCRIDSEGKNLIIEAEVDNLNWYDNVYIEEVYIEDKATVSHTPSTDPVERNLHTKKIKLCINYKELGFESFNDKILYVYIRASGAPSIDCPCGMDNEYTIGIAVNLRPIYNQAMQYIKELDNNCDIPKNFIDMILRLKAFDLSLKTGNYSVAEKQYDKFFNKKINMLSKNNCGCR